MASLKHKANAFIRYKTTELKFGKILRQLARKEQERLSSRTSKHHFQRLSALANCLV